MIQCLQAHPERQRKEDKEKTQTPLGPGSQDETVIQPFRVSEKTTECLDPYLSLKVCHKYALWKINKRWIQIALYFMFSPKGLILLQFADEGCHQTIITNSTGWVRQQSQHVSLSRSKCLLAAKEKSWGFQDFSAHHVLYPLCILVPKPIIPPHPSIPQAPLILLSKLEFDGHN